MIMVMQFSTELALWHSTVVTLSSMLLMLHVSHFAVSAGPTAHHLMAVGAALVACSGRQGVCVQLCRALNLLIWGFDCSIWRKKICKKIEIREKSVIPLLRERIMLMYPAPKYRKESVFGGSFTSLTVESLNIRFWAGA